MWVMESFWYGVGIIKWFRGEMKKTDKTRKMLSVHKAFHLKSDIDRLYLPRRNGVRELTSCQNCIEAEENSLG